MYKWRIDATRPSLDGLHHVTAITGDPSACRDFYGGLLGLNPLDPELAYESIEGPRLAFGDRLATPGAIINFLVVPDARRGRAGVGAVSRIGWRVAGADGLDFWRLRLGAAGVATGRRQAAGPDALPALRFHDPEGLEHELRIDASGDEPLVGAADGVPERVALRGLDGVDVRCRDHLASANLLAGHLDFATDGDDALTAQGPTRRGRYAYEVGAGPPPREGAGTVHHVAWTCEHGQERIWRQRVVGPGAAPTRIDDRGYFRSLRFREPSGVRFEIVSCGLVTREQSLLA